MLATKQQSIGERARAASANIASVDDGSLDALLDEETSGLVGEFPPERWRRIRQNDGAERINREIRRRTKVVGTFPDGNSTLMLVTARLKFIVRQKYGKRRCLDISKLDEMDELKGEAKGQKRTGPRTAKSICERIMTVPENVTQPLTLPSSHYDN